MGIVGGNIRYSMMAAMAAALASDIDLRAASRVITIDDPPDPHRPERLSRRPAPPVRRSNAPGGNTYKPNGKREVERRLRQIAKATGA